MNLNHSTRLQHLNNLLENYLEPLKRETFLSSAEINALFGNIHEIVTFQRQFLQNLEEALDLEPDFHKFEHSSQFRVSTNPNISINLDKYGLLSYPSSSGYGYGYVVAKMFAKVRYSLLDNFAYTFKNFMLTIVN